MYKNMHSSTHIQQLLLYPHIHSLSFLFLLLVEKCMCPQDYGLSKPWYNPSRGSDLSLLYTVPQFTDPGFQCAIKTP